MLNTNNQDVFNKKRKDMSLKVVQNKDGNGGFEVQIFERGKHRKQSCRERKRLSEHILIALVHYAAFRLARQLESLENMPR